MNRSCGLATAVNNVKDLLNGHALRRKEAEDKVNK